MKTLEKNKAMKWEDFNIRHVAFKEKDNLEEQQRQQRADWVSQRQNWVRRWTWEIKVEWREKSKGECDKWKSKESWQGGALWEGGRWNVTLNIHVSSSAPGWARVAQKQGMECSRAWNPRGAESTGQARCGGTGEHIFLIVSKDIWSRPTA